MSIKKNPLGYAIGCALLVTLSPAQAATIGQVDVSSEEGDLLILDDDQVVYTGKGAAIRVSGKQNGFMGSDMDVRATAGGSNDAVTGLQVVSGGQGTLQGSTLKVRPAAISATSSVYRHAEGAGRSGYSARRPHTTVRRCLRSVHVF